MKKISTLCLSLILVGASAFSGCGQTSDDLLKLSEVDSEVTVEIGSEYTLPNVTGTINGETAPVTVTVKDSDGVTVNLENGSFYVGDMDGYTVVYTLSNADRKISKTLNVNVSDTTKPIINLTGTRFEAMKGSRFDLSDLNVTIVDNSGESISPAYRIFYNGNTEQTIEATDGILNIAEYGYYTIEITATDSSENTGRREVRVDVTGAAVTDILNDFETEFPVNSEIGLSFTNENTKSGKGLLFESASALSDPDYPDWWNIMLPVERWDMSPYFEYSLYVHSSVACSQFWLVNPKGSGSQALQLAQGENALRFTREQFESLYPDSYLDSENPCLTFQIHCTEDTVLVFDDLKASRYEMAGADLLPPVIILDEDEYSLKQGETFVLPKILVTDNSYEEIAPTVELFYGDEKIENFDGNSFVAEQVGEYKIVVTATDKAGNSSTENITVTVIEQNRVKTLLNGFEADADARIGAGEKTLTTEHAVKGNALKYEIPVAEGTVWGAMWAKIPMPNVSCFESFEISVYATSSVPVHFYLNGKSYPLVAGQNILRITAEDFASQYPNGIVNDMEVLFSIGVSESTTFYFDNFYGIYAEKGDSDSEAPTLYVGETTTKYTVGEGFVFPYVYITDNSGELIAPSYTVSNGSETVTLAEAAYRFEEEGNYTITVIAKDSAGNESTHEINVEVEPVSEKTVLNDFNDLTAFSPSNYSTSSLYVDTENGSTASTKFYYSKADFPDGANIFMVMPAGFQAGDYTSFELKVYCDLAPSWPVYIEGTEYTLTAGWNTLKKDSLTAADNCVMLTNIYSNQSLNIYISSLVGINGDQKTLIYDGATAGQWNAKSFIASSSEHRAELGKKALKFTIDRKAAVVQSGEWKDPYIALTIFGNTDLSKFGSFTLTVYVEKAVTDLEITIGYNHLKFVNLEVGTNVIEFTAEEVAAGITGNDLKLQFLYSETDVAELWLQEFAGVKASV